MIIFGVNVSLNFIQKFVSFIDNVFFFEVFIFKQKALLKSSFIGVLKTLFLLVFSFWGVLFFWLSLDSFFVWVKLLL